MYEVFEHTADLGLRVRAASREELLVEAARGLMSIVVANLADVRPLQELSLHVDGGALDYLLFDWLGELLYVYETQHLVLCQFEVRLGPTGLDATVRGEPVDPARHRLEHEVKAITYHGLKVEPADGRWLAEVIVDI